MEFSNLAIPLGFILLAAVLCWQLIGGGGTWWFKLITIVCVPAFGLAVWSSIGSYKGWPTGADPPEMALVLGAHVREPDAAKHIDGAVFVWLAPIDALPGGSFNPLRYVPDGAEPRSFKLPYSRQLHKKMNQAQLMLSQGQPVMFEWREKGSSAEGDERRSRGGNKRPRGDGDRPNGESGQEDGVEDESDIRIYELPTIRSVPKD